MNQDSIHRGHREGKADCRCGYDSLGLLHRLVQAQPKPREQSANEDWKKERAVKFHETVGMFGSTSLQCAAASARKA